MKKIYIILGICIFIVIWTNSNQSNFCFDSNTYHEISKVLDDESVALAASSTEMNVEESKTVDKVYDLLAYCDDVSKTEEFIMFLNSLDEVENKILQIPEGHSLILNHYILLPSNCRLMGGKIVFAKDAVYAEVFNEAYILNRHSKTYWDKLHDTNISISGVEIEYDCSLNGRSLFRFRDVSNVLIQDCNIYIYNSDKNKISHNAAIDLFKGCKNILIQNNIISLDSVNSYAGGAIWIRAMTPSKVDEVKMITEGITIRDNVISSNSCDELIAVGTSGWHVNNVIIENNILVREENSNKNLMLAVCPSIYGNIHNVVIKDNIFEVKNNKIPQYNREIIRIGGKYRNAYNFKIEDVSIENNRIQGNLEKCTAISAMKEDTNNAKIVIKNNSINNCGEVLNSYGIKACGENKLSQNVFINIQNELFVNEETLID